MHYLQPKLALWTLLCGTVFLTSCGILSSGEICSEYSEKLVSCEVIGADEQEAAEGTCVTLLAVGTDSEQYTCVIEAQCEDIVSECGI